MPRAGCGSCSATTCLSVDTAMAGGVEDTRESTHLIRLAEDYAAEAWGSDRAWFLVNGSTSGIHALILTLCGPGADGDRPAQRAQVHAGRPHLLRGRARVRGAGRRPRVGHPGGRRRRAGRGGRIAAHPEATAVFVTSPTYNGLGTDLAAVADAAHAVSMPFVTDQAWGPHLRFCSRLPVDAMSAGADAAVVSTHKLISGITQTSVLLARAAGVNLARLDGMVHMTQSTSPQALMYASIDAARQQMATCGEELWTGAVELAEWARARIDELPGVRCLGRRFHREVGGRLVRPHPAHGLRGGPRSQRLRAGDHPARRVPHRRGGRRPAQRGPQRHLRRLTRRPRAPGVVLRRLRHPLPRRRRGRAHHAAHARGHSRVHAPGHVAARRLLRARRTRCRWRSAPATSAPRWSPPTRRASPSWAPAR